MTACDLRAGEIDAVSAALDDQASIIIHIPLKALHVFARGQRSQVIAARDRIARCASPAWFARARHFRRINAVQAPLRSIGAADIVAVMVIGRGAAEHRLLRCQGERFSGRARWPKEYRPENSCAQDSGHDGKCASANHTPYRLFPPLVMQYLPPRGPTQTLRPEQGQLYPLVSLRNFWLARAARLGFFFLTGDMAGEDE